MSQAKIKFNNKLSTAFVAELKQNVNSYFSENNLSPYANPAMVFKTIILFSVFSGSYSLILWGNLPVLAQLALCIVLGASMAGIGFAVQHDANHGAYSANPTVNRLLGFSLNIVGGNDYMWKIKHNILHHTYTNIHGKDEDISVASFLRLSPNAPYKPIHKIQHLVAWFAYSFLTLGWVLYFDYPKLYRYNGHGSPNPEIKHPAKEIAILIGTKLFYYSYMFVLPFFVSDLAWWQILTGILVVHFTSGLVLTVVFQLAHVVGHTQHPVPSEIGLVDNAWAIHQLETTSNFDMNNQWLTWYVGGLNYQVEHHLFPKICSIHYPAMSKIVQQTAQKYGVPYHAHRNLSAALVSHYQTLRAFSKPPSKVKRKQRLAEPV